MKTKNHITYWAALCMALAFVACTSDETVAPAVPDAGNALAQLPGNTPVRIITLLDGEETDSRAEEKSETFAANEIHEQGKMMVSLYIMTDEIARVGNDGGEIEADFTAGSDGYVTFDDISAMKNAEENNLTLEAFPNKNEWTILWGENKSGVLAIPDSICGWSQLAVHAETRKPVLTYHMYRTRAKVTLKLQNADTNSEMCLGNGVSATIYTEETLSSVVKEESGFALAIFNNPLKVSGLRECSLGLPYDAEGTMQNLESEHATEENITELTGLVRASATHKYTLTDASTMETGGTISRLTDTDMEAETVNIDDEASTVFEKKAYLSVTIEDNYPHLNEESEEVGGTYRINLEDVDMGDGKKLTRLEAGHHYILTLTLSHNKLVSATATLGGWDEYTGAGTVGGDESKAPETNDDEQQS